MSEKLNEIKERHSGTEYSCVTESDVDWLIEQAEEADILDKENERLRTALKDIAEDQLHHYGRTTLFEIAMKALEG